MSYKISDAGYPENMHVYDSFKEGSRYGILTDGTTVFWVTKHTEEVVFDQKSIRYQDGRWVHNETEIEKLLRSGEIRDSGSVEWTVHGYWTSIRYDTSPELWEKIRVYTPAKPWQYEVPEVPYRCLVGSKKVYSWRPESYQYIYDIENLDEYNRYYTGRQDLTGR